MHAPTGTRTVTAATMCGDEHNGSVLSEAAQKMYNKRVRGRRNVFQPVIAGLSLAGLTVGCVWTEAVPAVRFHIFSRFFGLIVICLLSSLSLFIGSSLFSRIRVQLKFTASFCCCPCPLSTLSSCSLREEASLLLRCYSVRLCSDYQFDSYSPAYYIPRQRLAAFESVINLTTPLLTTKYCTKYLGSKSKWYLH